MGNSSDQTEASVEEAKSLLARRGMEFSEDDFIRYVKSGRAETVDLYLRAGISPNMSLDGESALAASANHGHKQITQLLLDCGADPAGLVDGLKIGNTKRDIFCQAKRCSAHCRQGP